MCRISEMMLREPVCRSAFITKAIHCPCKLADIAQRANALLSQADQPLRPILVRGNAVPQPPNVRSRITLRCGMPKLISPAWRCTPHRQGHYRRASAGGVDEVGDHVWSGPYRRCGQTADEAAGVLLRWHILIAPLSCFGSDETVRKSKE
jgi:hypothetical protein